MVGDPQSTHFAGIRCTNEPSPWMGDFGQFLIRPFINNVSPVFRFPRTFPDEAFAPHLINVTFLNMCSEAGCARMELTPADHGALISITIPKDIDGDRYISFHPADGIISSASDSLLQGYSAHLSHKGAVNFSHYFSAKFEFGGDTKGTFLHDLTNNRIGWTKIDGAEKEVVLIRIGTSYISSSQATLNAVNEQGYTSFDKMTEKNKAAWDAILSRVVVPSDAPLHKKRTLYTSLYRSLLFPQDLSEIDNQGNRVHYSPYDSMGRVFPGRISTNSGFW